MSGPKYRSIIDDDLEVIAEQVKTGFTSGQFSDGNDNTIAWEVRINKFGYDV